MKKRVVKYVRVSTDEQRDKGYSLRDQEERLKRECEKNGHKIVGIYREDSSAKSFSNRPEWQKFVKAIKSKELVCDILLCAKPDRLSRNLSAYLNEKAWLTKNDILIKYLEGGVDHEDPSSFLIEILNNSLPQIDNMNRSINVTRGMRQAMKEGRYVNNAPFGYKNSDGTILPDENAPFVISAFNEVSKGLEAPEIIRKKLISQGFKGCERK